MTRTILAIATALLAPALFGTAAQACISCEYVPEVVSTPSPGKSYLGKSYERKRVAPSQKVAKLGLSEKRIAKAERAQRNKTEVARVEPAKPEPTKVEPAKTETADAAVETTKPIETASLENDVSAGCVKYFPAIGQTMPVPCE
jgi:hypothetical protein